MWYNKKMELLQLHSINFVEAKSCSTRPSITIVLTIHSLYRESFIKECPIHSEWHWKWNYIFWKKSLRVNSFACFGFPCWWIGRIGLISKCRFLSGISEISGNGMSEAPHKHDIVATVAAELSAWLLNEAQLMSIDENTRLCKDWDRAV